MTRKRKFSGAFKFKVALEAAKNEKTRSQLASEFEVHPTQVSQWKNELLNSGADLFDMKRPKRQEKEQAEKEIALYEQIGRLKMELEWLKKKAGHLA